MDELSAEALRKYTTAYRGERYHRKSGFHAHASKDQIITAISRTNAEIGADFGCGPGDAALLLSELGINFTYLLDIMPSSNLRDGVLRHIRHGKASYTQTSLWSEADMPKSVDLGVCTDVMEHMPPDYVDSVLANIAKRVKVCVFRIACFGDKPATVLKYGTPIHWSVHEPKEWRGKLLKHFKVLDDESTAKSIRLYDGKPRETYCVTAYT